jgi:uncharacterized protein
MAIDNWDYWESQFAQFINQQIQTADPGHDLAHIRRVVANAKQLAQVEGADYSVVVPAAWLHDCVVVSKDSDQRKYASGEASKVAGKFLQTVGYPENLIPDIQHAIEAHSFSAGIEPKTLAAQVVQDADRLDAIGAIGIARCLMVGGGLQRSLYHSDEPFPEAREPDDSKYALDHFFAKLLHLPKTMQTSAAQAEAKRRIQFMETYLEQLRLEMEPRTI